MKINAFKVNQHSEHGRKYNIYMSSVSIFDLKDYVYVKTVGDYMSDEDKTKSRILAQDGIINYQKTVTIRDINEDEDRNESDIHEVQRNLKNDKLKSISNYINGDFGIFPTSVLLGTKSNDFLNIKEETNGLFHIDVNEEKKGQEGFFIIDGQHRIFGLLNHILEKLQKEFEVELKENFNNNFDPVVNEINFILDKIGEDERNKFIKNNTFDLPVVIINELIENKMALLFADINSNSTKLDSNLETWIYGKTDETKKYIRIFVQIGEKLNSNPNSSLGGRFKIPTNLYPNEFSKIGIKPFCDNSLKLLNFNKERTNYNYINKPFNLLLDELSKYEDIISDDTVDFMINGLMIIYFVVFHNARSVYSYKNWDNKEYAFINTNNLGLYLYIIKYITLKLYSQNKDHFLKIFYDEKTIEKINSIFKNDIEDPLRQTYIEYEYFEKGKVGGSGAAKEAQIVKFFKRKLYKIEVGIKDKKDKDIDQKNLNTIFAEKENFILSGNI